MATAAAAADAQRHAASGHRDSGRYPRGDDAQLDEQIAALDLKIRQLQGGNSAAMLSGPSLKAAGLGIERRKLADERARLAGEDPAPRSLAAAGRTETPPAATAPAAAVASATSAPAMAMTVRGGNPARGRRGGWRKNIF